MNACNALLTCAGGCALLLTIHASTVQTAFDPETAPPIDSKLAIDRLLNDAMLALDHDATDVHLGLTDQLMSVRGVGGEEGPRVTAEGSSEQNAPAIAIPLPPAVQAGGLLLAGTIGITLLKQIRRRRKR